MSSKGHDVIVAGLGAMGAAALYQLSAMGMRVLDIDRHNLPHRFGSSHGESRITRQAIGEGGEYVGLALRSNEIWRQLEEETGGKLFLRTGIAVIGTGAGGPVLHGKADFVGDTARVARQYGIEHEVLPGAELGYRYPQFMLQGNEIAYFEPGAGVLFPEKCVEAELRLAGISEPRFVSEKRFWIGERRQREWFSRPVRVSTKQTALFYRRARGCPRSPPQDLQIL